MNYQKIMAIFKKQYKELVNILTDFFLIVFFSVRQISNYQNFTIITGSDSTHFKSLINLLNTLKKYEKNSVIKVIDLGMSGTEIAQINENYDFEIEQFNFDKYPQFVKKRDKYNKLGAYAWKPISINKEFNSTKNNIIWLDAGCIITKELKLLKKIITKNGFYSPESSDNIRKWTHPAVLEALNVKKNVHTKRNVSGGIVGFSKNISQIADLLEEWSTQASNLELIAPKGSSRDNHRQDQALLSLLVHKYNLSTFTLRTHKMFGILKHQDVDDDYYK
jgi:hypothetical protein